MNYVILFLLAALSGANAVVAIEGALDGRSWRFNAFSAAFSAVVFVLTVVVGAR